METKTLNINGEDTEFLLIDKQWMKSAWGKFIGLFGEYAEMMEHYPIRFYTYHYPAPFEEHKNAYGLARLISKDYERLEGHDIILIDPMYSVIWMRNDSWLPEKIYEKTFIHEMCHIACLANKLSQGADGHSNAFVEMARLVKENSNGEYDIESFKTNELEASIKSYRKNIINSLIAKTKPSNAEVTESLESITDRFLSSKFGGAIVSKIEKLIRSVFGSLFGVPKVSKEEDGCVSVTMS